MNLRELIARLSYPGRTRVVDPPDVPSSEQVLAAAAEARHPLTRNALHHHTHATELRAAPTSRVILGLAAGLHVEPAVVAVASLVSQKVAPGYLTEVVERALAAVKAGAEPEDVMDALDELTAVHQVGPSTVVIPEGTVSAATVVDMAERAEELINRKKVRDSRGGTVPPARNGASSVERRVAD